MNDIIALLITVAGIAIVIWFLNWDSKRSARLKREKEKREAEELERQQKENEEILAKYRKLKALAEVKRQAEVMDDEDTMDSVDGMTYDGRLPEKRDDGEWLSIYEDLRIFKIVGMKYRGNLSAYVGNFSGTLVPEPKNEYDPFAIMVKAEDGKHIGYIKEEQTGIVRWLVGAEQPLGENEPTKFKPYRVTGWIYEEEYGEGKKVYNGCVYVRKKKEE